MFLDILSLSLLVNLALSTSNDKGVIINQYAWIVYSQDNDEKYLTLKTDGTVVISLLGKYKIKDPTEPSASLREILSKFIIYLDDKPICSNGYGKPVSACEKSQSRLMRFNLLQTKYGTMIENEGLCITKGVQLVDDGDLVPEWEGIMMPCDDSVEQMFTIQVTDHTNVDV